MTGDDPWNTPIRDPVSIAKKMNENGMEYKPTQTSLIEEFKTKMRIKSNLVTKSNEIHDRPVKFSFRIIRNMSFDEATETIRRLRGAGFEVE